MIRSKIVESTSMHHSGCSKGCGTVHFAISKLAIKLYRLANKCRISLGNFGKKVTKKFITGINITLCGQMKNLVNQHHQVSILRIVP